jgi:hypothetical protein
VTALKEWLREFASDTPLEEVAGAAAYSVTAVSDALRGIEVPRLRLVQSIARGVGAPLAQAHQLWWAAALEEFAKRNPVKPAGSLAGFALDLRRAMLRNDLSKTEVLSRMARLCKTDGDVTNAMSRATLCRLLGGTTLPRSDQMNVFLRVLGLREREIEQLTRDYEALSLARAQGKSAKSRSVEDRGSR